VAGLVASPEFRQDLVVNARLRVDEALEVERVLGRIL
jgi:hypothetical protein